MLLKVVLACLLLLSLLVAQPAHAATPIRIMALGDSITMGQCCFWNNPDDWVGYRKPLKALLAADGVAIDYVGSQKYGAFEDNENEGHGGFSARLLLPITPAAITTYKPAIVLLLVGANDSATEPDRAQRNFYFRALLVAIQQADPSVETVVSTVIPNTTDPAWGVRVNEMNADRPAIIAERVAAGQRVRLADVGARVPTEFLLDGTHPDPRGYAILAQRWEPAVLDVLAHPSAACSPRPAVTIQTAASNGAIRVTATATGRGGPIRSVTFGAGRNTQAVTDLAIVGNSATFTVKRAAAGAFTQPFTVTDQCGSWPSFIGAGS